MCGTRWRGMRCVPAAQPVKPRLMRMSDRMVKVMIAIYFLISLIFVLASSIAGRSLQLSELVLPSGVGSSNGTLTFEFAGFQGSGFQGEASGHMAGRVAFIGVSLNASFLYKLAGASGVSVTYEYPYLVPLLQDPVALELEIVGQHCLRGKSHHVFNGTVKLTSTLLAMIDHVDCSAYKVVMRTDVMVNLPQSYLSLIFEMPAPKWYAEFVSVRVVAASVFFMVAAYRLACLIRSRMCLGAGIGMKSSILCCISVVLLCDPSSLLWYVITRWASTFCRWLYASALVLGNGLAMLMFIGELFADLRLCSKNLPGARCWCSLGSFSIIGVFLEALPFVTTMCANMWASASIANIERQDAVIGLAERFFQEQFWFILSVPLNQLVNLVYFIWQICRLYHMHKCLRKVPYSKCRTHQIIFSFVLISYLGIQVVFIIIFFVGALVAMVYEAEAWTLWNTHVASETTRMGGPGPWMQLDGMVSGMLLPGQGNASTIKFQIPWASALAMSFLLNCRPASAKETTGSHPHSTAASSDPVLATMPQDVEMFLSCEAQGNTHSGMAFVSTDSFPELHIVAPGQSMSSAAHHMACIPLHTVRLLAHISLCHRPGLEAESLGSARSAAEDDLEFTGIKLVRVVQSESLNLHASVLTAELPVAGSGGSTSVGIISFRGTSSIRNVLSDFNARMVPITLPCMISLARERGIAGAKVHNGFQIAASALREELTACVEGLNVDKIWCTGHSLGGALATLIATEMHLALSRRFFIAVCTFGSPRVGNHAFARLFRSSACVSVRVVFDNDPIPRLPPSGFIDPYEHIVGLVRIYANGHLVVNPNFLEEALRNFVRRLNPSHCVCCYCCICLLRMKFHRLVRYIPALKAVQQLESRAESSVLRE